MKKMFVLLTVVVLCFAGCKSAVEVEEEAKDQRNVKTAEEVLIGDYFVYGKSYVFFNANGATEGAMQPQQVDSSTIKLNKNMFTCSNAQFRGWAKQPDGEVVYSDEETINFPNYPQQVTHLKLYARWGLQAMNKTAVTETWGDSGSSDSAPAGYVVVSKHHQGKTGFAQDGDTGRDGLIAVGTPNSN